MRQWWSTTTGSEPPRGCSARLAAAWPGLQRPGHAPVAAASELRPTRSSPSRPAPGMSPSTGASARPAQVFPRTSLIPGVNAPLALLVLSGQACTLPTLPLTLPFSAAYC